VDGISEEKFAELVKDAEANCPISKLLNTKISVEYSLNA
jgi:osmotically inducible protein OsmC